jgi:hypothetical protein
VIIYDHAVLKRIKILEINMMKKFWFLAFVLLISNCFYAQSKSKDNNNKDDIQFEKTTSILDRAGGVHNASNIGLYFENRGKLYPRRISQGPSGEFPINSGQHYIYRINPMVGIPGNVIQGRFTTDEEWEAAFGYNNRELAKIAFSDNPKTWPSTGWPVKDKNGNSIFKSDQDSYCVYNDSNNARRVLDIYVAQTGYAYGLAFAKNLLFFKFDVINNGKKNLDSVYFNFYTDIDVGDASGGVAEYADDKLGIDKSRNFVYFYDDGLTTEWPSGKTGYFGVILLKTPNVNGKELGLTDLHYNLYDDDTDIDTIQFGIMSSSPGLYKSSFGSKFFHPGSAGNYHFDDPATIPVKGMDLVANLASGPYALDVGDTLTFYTAIVAGTDYNDISNYVNAAYKILDFDFEISKPPQTPTLTGFAGDGKATLYWDDKAESSIDKFSQLNDFEGYRLYRSQDKGVTWELLKDYDLVDNIGYDIGLQYSYTDTTINNGFEYWYSLTAYDRGDSSVASLETPKGNTTDAINVVSITPVSTAIGRTPVSADQAAQAGKGVSNYIFNVQPVDNDTLKDREYKVGFTYTSRQEKGAKKVSTVVIVDDSSQTFINSYGVEWVTKNTFHLMDYATDKVIGQDPKSYRSGSPITILSGPGGKKYLELKLIGPAANAPADSLPKTGDVIKISFSMYAIRNNKDTVIYPKPFVLNKEYATSDGVIFKVVAPEVVKSVSKVGGTDQFEITFSVVDSAKLKEDTYLISVENNGTDAGGRKYVNLLVKNSKQETVLMTGNLYPDSTFTFNGLEGAVSFPANLAPSPGNIISVESIIPKRITMNDVFDFKIIGSSINQQTIAQKISNIKVVPNPYLVSSLYEPEYGELRKEPLRQIQFINLPNECTVYIFTLDADRIKTINHNSVNGTETWDLRTDGGREIAPGIYIYLVKTKETEYLSRFAVIK